MNLNHLFDKRLAETDLMLGETATGELSRPQLTLMMKTMMQDEDGRADLSDVPTASKNGIQS